MTNLGSCCLCQGTFRVRTVIALPHPSPTPGRGWGCIVCGLPSDGAVAVVCDRCANQLKRAKDDPINLLKFVCTGYPGEDGRTPIDKLNRERFEHDSTKHE